MSEPSKQTAWERWELASFDTVPLREEVLQSSLQSEEVSETVKLPTAEEIEQIHQQAHEEGYQRGQKEGYQAGYAEGQAKARAEAQHLLQVAGQLERTLNELEQKIADELLALAIELARSVIRQEISAHPKTLLAIVREALGQLPHQHAAIYLHPDDASLLRSYMGDQLAHAGHRIHEDDKLMRGDCIVEAGGSQIDATVAMRWQRTLDSLGVTSAWQPPPTPVAGSSDASADES